MVHLFDHFDAISVVLYDAKLTLLPFRKRTLTYMPGSCTLTVHIDNLHAHIPLQCSLDRASLHGHSCL